MSRVRSDQSLTLVTACLVFMIAVLAGGSLFILRRMMSESTHNEVARLVVQEGSLIASHLAQHPAVRDEGDDTVDWTDFSEQVRALRAVEDGLQYVQVTRNGVTVFSEQTVAPEGSAPTLKPIQAAVDDEVRLSRRLINVRGERVPVVVFHKRFAEWDGEICEVEVGIRKDTVEREEQTVSTALAAMFRLSLATTIVSFAICVVLVVWMMRREVRREWQRRRQEHLAYAGVLANGIVHDFRNPMSAMQLDVQMLNREVARGDACRQDRLAELAGRIEKTMARMDKVFREFLYQSKSPTDEREPMDLAGALRDCLEIVAARFDDRGITARLDVPTTPVMVRAYPSALQRALMNIIVNAEHASKEGGQVVVRVASEGRNAVVDVIDSGEGVPARDRERIFDMFFTTRPQGAGLGLFLARTAIERCGGTISVLDAPGGGACFRILLPLLKEERADGEASRTNC